MSDINWDEYDGEVIDGIRYANTFTANMAKNSRIIGASEEQARIIQLLENKRQLHLASMNYPLADAMAYTIRLIQGENK